MEKLFCKPPAHVDVRGSHNDDGPVTLFMVWQHYPLSSFNRPFDPFPAASLLNITLIKKVEGMGECGNGH